MTTARLLTLSLVLLAVPAVAFAGTAASCPQLFPGGQPPALVNPRLAQRTTMLCNDAYAVLASDGDLRGLVVRRAPDRRRPRGCA